MEAVEIKGFPEPGLTGFTLCWLYVLYPHGIAIYLCQAYHIDGPRTYFPPSSKSACRSIHLLWIASAACVQLILLVVVVFVVHAEVDGLHPVDADLVHTKHLLLGAGHILSGILIHAHVLLTDWL